MKDQKYLSVTDTSATGGSPVREHTIMVNGEVERVKFEYGKPTILPYAIGAKFMVPGFIVKDFEGNEVSLPDTNADTLAEDEVIAKLSELTDEALILRALAKKDGEQFASGDTSRAILIDFLTGAADADEDEDAELELDEDDLDNADVSDNSLPLEHTGIVPENAEDEIVLDVSGAPDETPNNPDDAISLGGGAGGESVGQPGPEELPVTEVLPSENTAADADTSKE